MYLTKNGVKTHEFAYSTYGELTLGEYGEIRFLYNGQYGVAADDNGLYYMRARYYNPEIRRFINQDILTGSIENSQSLNRYAYCQGNPVNYFDPFGLEPCNFFSGLGHTVLNLLGLIPGIGDAFDIVNAGWYIAEGRWDKAFEAGIAAIPIFGNFMPDTGLFRYIKRGLNLVSYGGTGFLAGQGMWEGGQALWEEINSKNCSGWKIAGNIVGIGLNGVSLFFSGKGFISETKTLNKMLKDDGGYEWLKLDNGGYINFDAFKSGNKTGAGEYVTPSGGGGVTSTIKVNGQTVNFGHGGRHLEGTGLNVNIVNQALANEVSTLNLETGQFHKGQIIIGGITIEYTSYGVSEGIINIGTYYPLK